MVLNGGLTHVVLAFWIMVRCLFDLCCILLKFNWRNLHWIRSCHRPFLALGGFSVWNGTYSQKKVRQEAPGLIRGEEWRKTLFKWS